MVDFASALQAASAGIGVLKELNRAEQEFDKAGLKLKFAELSQALATVQLALAEAQAEAGKKDAEIAKLRENFKQKTDGMIEYDGYFFRKGSDGKPKGKPIVRAV